MVTFIVRTFQVEADGKFDKLISLFLTDAHRDGFYLEKQPIHFLVQGAPYLMFIMCKHTADK